MKNIDSYPFLEIYSIINTRFLESLTQFKSHVTIFLTSNEGTTIHGKFGILNNFDIETSIYEWYFSKNK